MIDSINNSYILIAWIKYKSTQVRQFINQFQVINSFENSVLVLFFQSGQMKPKILNSTISTKHLFMIDFMLYKWQSFKFGIIVHFLHRFSVNFTLECCPIPLNVAYHFKTNFVDNTVRHNYKTVGSWNDEIIEENTWIQGSGNNNIIHQFVGQIVIFIFMYAHAHTQTFSFEHSNSW